MLKSNGLQPRLTRNLIILVALLLLTTGTLAIGLSLPVQAAAPAQAQDATPTPDSMMDNGMMGGMSMGTMMAQMNSMMATMPVSGTTPMSGMMPMCGMMPMTSMMSMSGTMSMANTGTVMQVMGMMQMHMGCMQMMMGSMMSGAGVIDNMIDATAGIPPNPNQQVVVHDMGAQVMPFDLSKTTHIFEMTESGGIQQVIAKDPQDTEQIALIQQHIQHEAMQFRAGDFSDPASLHGVDMPGIKELAASVTHIKIDYMALANGARITFTTQDLRLITAIHRWFGAQLSDHGSDATYR